MRPSLRLLATALLALGCAEKSPTEPPIDYTIAAPLTASVLDAAPEAGEYVDVRFENLTGSAFAFSGCARGVERWADGAWSSMPAELRLCIAMVDRIDAHSVSTFRVDVSADAVPGSYRFRFDLIPDGGDESDPTVLRSSVFEVR